MTTALLLVRAYYSFMEQLGRGRASALGGVSSFSSSSPGLQVVGISVQYCYRWFTLELVES